MKLKKIAALALAGIMAVSMLAGCGEGAGSTNNTQTEVTVSSTDIVSVVNDTVKGNKAGVSFASNADFDKLFELAIAEKGVVKADILAGLIANLDADPTYVELTSTTNLNPNDKTLNSANDADKDYNTVEVYVYSDKGMTAQSAAYQTAVEVNKIVKGLEDKATLSNVVYDCNYSKAYASMKTVTAGDDTYYVVAVSLTSHYTKAE